MDECSRLFHQRFTLKIDKGLSPTETGRFEKIKHAHFGGFSSTVILKQDLLMRKRRERNQGRLFPSVYHIHAYMLLASKCNFLLFILITRPLCCCQSVRKSVEIYICIRIQICVISNCFSKISLSVRQSLVRLELMEYLKRLMIG